MVEACRRHYPYGVGDTLLLANGAVVHLAATFVVFRAPALSVAALHCFQS
jgi:hypothetical protein